MIQKQNLTTLCLILMFICFTTPMAESGWNTCEACRTYGVHENNELCIESFTYSRHDSVLLSDADPADPERLACCVSPNIRLTRGHIA
jgi:hypothetical protein